MTRTDKEVKAFNERIRYERRRIVSLYDDLSEDAMGRCSKLFDQMAFLAVSIAQLQKDISQDGTTIDYQNGENQWGTKVNPDVDTLNKYLQQYRHTKKSIDDELPREYEAPKDDGFDAFINS